MDSIEEHSSSISKVDEKIKERKVPDILLRQFPLRSSPFAFTLNQGCNDLLTKAEILKGEIFFTEAMKIQETFKTSKRTAKEVHQWDFKINKAWVAMR